MISLLVKRYQLLLFTSRHGFDKIAVSNPLKLGLVFSFYMTTPVTFLKEAVDELKKVVWPTKEEVIRLTTVVILVSLGVGLFLGGLDIVFTKIIETFVK